MKYEIGTRFKSKTKRKIFERIEIYKFLRYTYGVLYYCKDLNSKRRITIVVKHLYLEQYYTLQII